MSARDPLAEERRRRVCEVCRDLMPEAPAPPSRDRVREDIARCERIEKAARSLFAALDYVTPDWREKTCVIDEDSDEVNVAWCELENALDGPLDALDDAEGK